MHVQRLLSYLSALKKHVEESITLVESGIFCESETEISNLLDACTEYIGLARKAISGSTSYSTSHENRASVTSHSTEMWPLTEANKMKSINQEEERPFFQASSSTENIIAKTENIEESIDNLDDFDFDDFLDDAPNTASSKTCGRGTTERLSDDLSETTEKTMKFKVSGNGVQLDYNDCPSDMSEGEEEIIRQEMNDERLQEEDCFNDWDIDEKALESIAAAEKQGLEEIQSDKDESKILGVDEDEFDDVNQPDDPTVLEVLKQYFGYSQFRPMQWKIINSVLNEKRDNCVIMATGYGKSLTFQFPSVFTKRTSVIISPLISLMEDQVHGLKASNIEACFLGSAQTSVAAVKEAMFAGKYRLVYLTPELATSAFDDLMRLNKSVGIDLIAIDEAHCVSQWGHDFRAAYRNLGVLKDRFPKVPILAVTATATFEVREDICRSLHLKNPHMVCTGFDRPNLFLKVLPKTGDVATDLKCEMKRIGNKLCFDGPTIIYCPSKKATEEAALVVKGMNIACLPYHASMSLSARKEAHHKFLNDEIEVVVATIAFGMGIDKPDVRKVIHYGAPKDIESYYQEIGRAGRDGMPSICTTFFSKVDFNTSRHFVREIRSEKFREHKMKMLGKMEQYLASATCRRRMLLSHFERGNLEEVGGTANCCDVCRQRIHCHQHDQKSSNETCELHDYSNEAADLFKVIEITGGRFGLGVPTFVLAGSQSKKVSQFKTSSLFGSGKYRSAKFWNALGLNCAAENSTSKSLIYEGYLNEKTLEHSFGATVELSQKGRWWISKFQELKGNYKLEIMPSQDLVEALPPKKVSITFLPTPALPQVSPERKKEISSSASTSSLVQLVPQVDERTAKLQTDLYIQLVKTRNQMSQETGFTPHNIASNKVLLDMAKFRPTSKASLLRLEDYSEVKADRFGQTFINLIKSYCEQHSLKHDDFPDLLDTEGDSGTYSASVKESIMRLTETQRQSYILFALQNNSVEEVASRRGLKTSTIVTHLCEALRGGLTVDISRLGVTPRMEKLITDAIWSPPVRGTISSLTKIKDQLPLSVEYNHIKVVVAVLVHQCGQNLNANGDTVLIGGPGPEPAMGHPDNSQAMSENVFSQQDTQSPKHSVKRQKTEPGFNRSPYQPYQLTKSISDAHQSINKFSSPSQSSLWLTSRGSSPSQARPDNSERSFSQTEASQGARKLPSWMESSGNKSVFKKKMKANKLFK